jgi:hypothetical protein
VTSRRGRTLLAALLAALFVGALLYATVRETGVRCEACVDFAGARACRAVSAADRDQATEQAVATACAVLARGVTQGFACQRTVPSSLHCDE